MKAYDTTQTTDDAFSNPVPHYVERYNFSAAPFSNIHEDRFLYLDAERLQRLNMLEHLTRYSELLLIISGPKGIGKSSLLQHFVVNADEDTLVSQVDANPMMDADKLLQAIAAGFDLNVQNSDPVNLQDALYHHLANLHHQQKVPVLVIDDAHVLPQDALETLFNLADAEASDGSLLRIILFSDPQIETMLQSPAIQGLRERVTHSMSIPAFDEEQTVGYIRHRLTTVGLQGALPFSDKELHKIFRNSSGIPTRINECAHLILNGDKLDQAVKDFHTPQLKLRSGFTLSALKIPSLKLPAVLVKCKRWQLGAVLIAVLAIALVLIYQDDINAVFEADTQQTKTLAEDSSPFVSEAAPQVTAQPEPEPLAVVDSASTEIAPLKTPRQQAIPEETDTAAPEQATEAKINTAIDSIPPVVAVVEKVSTPADAAIETDLDKPPTLPEPAALPPTPIIRDISPDPVNTSRKPQIISILGEHFNKDMKVTVFWTGGQKTLSSPQLTIINANEMELRITVGRKADNWKVQLNDPVSKQQIDAQFNVAVARKSTASVSKTTSKTTAKTSSGNTLNKEGWINKQKPQHFTLQLLGSHNKSSLQTFVKKHALEQEVATFSSLRNQRPWHVLIQGRYASRAKAEKAAASMSKNIRGIKPWIRPFADIQKTLRHQAVTPPPLTISKISSPPAASNLATSAAWLWSQDPSHYTLQLLAGQTEAGIKGFITKHKLSGKAVYYRTSRNGRPWYVLVYNSYSDHRSAKAAISTLPAKLRKTQPWPRSFASIHTELH